MAFALVLIVLFSSFKINPWGFFGHRRINRMAVFCLPPEMIRFYKKNIEFITEHAVDPDKRRYATKHEAVRHYIDIDHWGVYPFPEVPRDWVSALMKYTNMYMVNQEGDTIPLFGPRIVNIEEAYVSIRVGLVADEHPLLYNTLSESSYRQFFIENLLDQYYEDDWYVSCESLQKLFPDAGLENSCQSIYAVDGFSRYGILPYNLMRMQNNLTEAFRQGSIDRILRLSAEMGHYIGDAHVPLHTTTNYNGQLTNQVGIHAFWESRLPELFADNDYDFFVGKAQYINKPESYFWNIVLSSHQLVDSVLAVERRLSETFPQDKQYCYEERLGRTIRTQCKEYADAYHQEMKGMVEDRMKGSIHAIASSWYTAWVDAGQPDLNEMVQGQLSKKELREQEELETQFRQGDSKGRRHE